jgi:hypothetical protein
MAGVPRALQTIPLTTPRKGPPKPAALVAQALQRLEVQLGGRDRLVGALSFAPHSQDVQILLGLLGDPTNSREPIANLCTMAGVTPGQVLGFYRAGEENRSQALAWGKIGEHLADVAERTMQGALVVSEDLDAQRLAFDHKKLALDLGKMLPKSAGVQVAIQNNVSGGGLAGGSLEALQAATDAILYGDGGGTPPPEFAEPPSAPGEESEVPDIPDGEVLEDEEDEEDEEDPDSEVGDVQYPSEASAACSLDTDWQGHPVP